MFLPTPNRAMASSAEKTDLLFWSLSVSPNGVEGFLEPSVSERKRLVPRQLWLVVVFVEGTSQHFLSIR